MIDQVQSARNLYDWRKWTNGKAWRAVKGRDFECSPVAFRNSLYSAARRMDLKVIVAIKDDTVDFQFSKPAKSK